MRRHRRARSALILIAAGVAAACASDTTGPDAGPTLESRWDLDVTLRYLHSSSASTCDGKDLLGFVNPGEFQYRIKATFGSTTKTTESQGYGSVTGTSKTLKSDETWDFGNKTWTFENMKEKDAVTLTLYVTEWDGTDKDDYMNNRSNSLEIVPSSLLPTGGTKTDRGLGVGKSTCGLTLYFDVTARQRQVEVG